MYLSIRLQNVTSASGNCGSMTKPQGAHVMVRDEAKWPSGDDVAELKAALRSLDLKR